MECDSSKALSDAVETTALMRIDEDTREQGTSSDNAVNATNQS